MPSFIQFDTVFGMTSDFQLKVDIFIWCYETWSCLNLLFKLLHIELRLLWHCFGGAWEGRAVILPSYSQGEIEVYPHGLRCVEAPHYCWAGCQFQLPVWSPLTPRLRWSHYLWLWWQSWLLSVRSPLTPTPSREEEGFLVTGWQGGKPWLPWPSLTPSWWGALQPPEGWWHYIGNQI